MRDFKRYTSIKIRKQLELSNEQEILNRLIRNAKGYNNQKYKVWMDRYDDVMITTETVFCTKMNYIHNNPVKSGLVLKMEDWKYSSYRNYANNDHSVIKVNTNLELQSEIIS